MTSGTGWVRAAIFGFVRQATNTNCFFRPTGEISKDTAEKIFEKYIQSGGNFIDTANKVRLKRGSWPNLGSACEVGVPNFDPLPGSLFRRSLLLRVQTDPFLLQYHEGQTEEWLGEFIAKRGIRDDVRFDLLAPWT